MIGRLTLSEEGDVCGGKIEGQSENHRLYIIPCILPIKQMVVIV